MRGEQNLMNGIHIAIGGSPPLARGTDDVLYKRKTCVGITPACAGNSLLPFHTVHHSWDHPRLRGEQNKVIARTSPLQGSPPLARGTVLCVASCRPHAGITPACAGNRNRATKNWEEARDHPRLRGEQAVVIFCFSAARGLPPLARGTEILLMNALGIGGITPACAGNRR